MTQLTSPAPPDSGKAPLDRRKFWQRLRNVLLADLGVAAALTLLVGPRTVVGLSNFLFWSAAFLLGVAALPGLVRAGAGAGALARRANESGQSLSALLREDQARRKKDEPTMLVFGAAGILMLALSVLLSW